jgi:hypothetical protein
VTQDVPLGILRSGLSQVSPQPKVGCRRFASTPPFDRKTPEQGETASGKQLLEYSLQSRTESWQWKILRPDAGNIEIGANKVIGCAFDFVNLSIGENLNPVASIRLLWAEPTGSSVNLTWQRIS